jgi:hypothetical protein
MPDNISRRTRKWQHACAAAENETDPTKLLQFLSDIESGIFLRLQELGAGDFREREAIEKATATLRRLQIERLNYPKWQGEIPARIPTH